MPKMIEIFPKVSIRSPHGCKGRYHLIALFRVAFLVSIRSPHGCKGRYRPPTALTEEEKCFNPLPSRM